MATFRIDLEKPIKKGLARILRTLEARGMAQAKLYVSQLRERERRKKRCNDQGCLSIDD